MLPNIIKVLLAFIVVFSISSCTQSRLDVDIETVNIPEVKFQHLENDLFTLKAANVKEKTSELRAKYGLFYERYLTSFINAKGSSDSLYEPNVLQFVNDKDMLETQAYIKKTFSEDDFKKLEEEVIGGIKRFHYFFPKRKLPIYLTTCMSGFNYAIAYSDSTLAVGLDMYLGEDAPFYKMLNLPQYRTRIMNKNYIPTDLIRGWLLNEFDNDVPTNTLVNHTIFYGKIYFAVSTLMPDANDSTILGYSAVQMDYCKKYEKNLWGYMAEKNRLFENNMRTVQELTGEGPFTSAISKECPPGIAKWVGYQIVKSYMEKNESVTLEQLMNEKDAQKILNKSKYRP